MIATDMNASQFMEYDPEGNTHYIGHQVLYFNRLPLFEESWASNSFQMSYEVQVKMAWQKNRRYGALGLVVMLENEGGLSNGKSEGYYISLMRYLKQNESGRYWKTWSYNYDGIPNSIKPPGEAGQRLLVVWKQSISNGQLSREWIAYKDLSNRGDWVADVSDGYSGQGFKSLSTIGVRVVEARVADKKYHYLQVLRGDIKDGPARAGNESGHDINAGRLAYFPKNHGGSFPQWSPLDYDNWVATNDYFTLTRMEDGWDGVNTNGQSAIVILSDNGTIRTEALPTPDSGDWSADRYEVGLHATGNLSSFLSNEMYYDEFALRYLLNRAAGSGGSGGVSYYDE